MSDPAPLHPVDAVDATTQPARTPRLRLIPPPVWTDPDDRAVQRRARPTVLDLEFVLPNGLPAIPVVPSAARTTPRVDASERLPVGRSTRPGGARGGGSRTPGDAARAVGAPCDLPTARPATAAAGAAAGPAGSPRARCPEHVRSVHVCHPAPDVAEVSVVTAGAERCRALGPAARAPQGAVDVHSPRLGVNPAEGCGWNCGAGDATSSAGSRASLIPRGSMFVARGSAARRAVQQHAALRPHRAAARR